MQSSSLGPEPGYLPGLTSRGSSSEPTKGVTTACKLTMPDCTAIGNQLLPPVVLTSSMEGLSHQWYVAVTDADVLLTSSLQSSRRKI